MPHKRFLLIFAGLFVVLMAVAIVFATVGTHTHRPLLFAITGGLLALAVVLAPGLHLRAKKHRDQELDR
jgi:hypothetical protein